MTTNSETIIPDATITDESVIEQEQPEVIQEAEQPLEQPSELPETNEDEQYSKKVKKRIDQLVVARSTAERERQEAQAKAAALELRLQELQAGKQETKQAYSPSQGQPNPDDFDAGRYDPDYLEALTDWKVQQLFTKQQKDASLAEKQRNVITLHEAAKQTHPDYAIAEQSFLEHPLSAVDLFKELILDAENPAELSYFLGKNPDEMDKLGEMTDKQAIRYLGRLEARITASPSLEQPKKTVSNAPKPITPLGSAKSSAVVTDISEARDMAEYIRLRKAQQK
jgi:hypothetical protein